MDAEANYHATTNVVRVVDQFVRIHGRWPRSWDELETLSGPELEQVGWPRRASAFRQRVFIDFDANPAEVAQQPWQSFQAIRPIGLCMEYRDLGDVTILRDTMRQCIIDKGK
jgi:hypothetical protein